MYIESFERSKRILGWIEKDPAALGYFPKSTMSKDFNQAPASLAHRKYLEEDLIVSFFQGNMDSIQLYADNIDLMIFERYDDYLDSQFDEVTVQKILTNGSHYLLSAKPLEALLKAAVGKRLEGEKLDKAIDCLMSMGGKLYKQDQRYLAYAFYRIVDELYISDRNRLHALSEVLGKLAKRQVALDPEHFKTSEIPRTIIEDMSQFQYWREKPSSRLLRHSYLYSLLSYQIRHDESLIDPMRISGKQALEQMVMAYTFSSEERVLKGLAQHLPLEKMIDELNTPDLKFSNPNRYVMAGLRPADYNGAALLSLLISVGNGNTPEIRTGLIKGLLNAGMSKAFGDKDMQLCMIKHCARRGLSGETEFFSLIRPHLANYDVLGIKDETLFELAKDGNSYARSELRRLENDPGANDLLLRVGKTAPPHLIKWMIDKNVLGATPHMLRLSEHPEIKREVLSTDLGL